MVRRTYYLPAEVVDRLDRAVVELRLAAYVDRAPTKAEVIAATLVAGLEARQQVLQALRSSTTSAPVARGQGWQRPVALPGSLGDLEGPATGVITLPAHIHSSGAGADQRFDLSFDVGRATAYEIVLTEGTERDLGSLVNGPALRELWPSMFLPRYVREAWEAQFPELVS